MFVGVVLVGLEQFALLDDAAKNGGRDLRAGEPTLFDAEPIEQGWGGRFAVGFGPDFTEGV